MCIFPGICFLESNNERLAFLIAKLFPIKNIYVCFGFFFV